MLEGVTSSHAAINGHTVECGNAYYAHGHTLMWSHLPSIHIVTLYPPCTCFTSMLRSGHDQPHSCWVVTPIMQMVTPSPCTCLTSTLVPGPGASVIVGTLLTGAPAPRLLPLLLDVDAEGPPANEMLQAPSTLQAPPSHWDSPWAHDAATTSVRTAVARGPKGEDPRAE